MHSTILINRWANTKKNEKHLIPQTQEQQLSWGQQSLCFGFVSDSSDGALIPSYKQRLEAVLSLEKKTTLKKFNLENFHFPSNILYNHCGRVHGLEEHMEEICF